MSEPTTVHVVSCGDSPVCLFLVLEKALERMEELNSKGKKGSTPAYHIRSMPLRERVTNANTLIYDTYGYRGSLAALHEPVGLPPAAASKK